MDPAALASLCLLLSHGGTAQPLPAGVNCPTVTSVPARGSGVTTPPSALAALVNTPEARDAIARVAYGEAANQGDSGLGGVVYTIINRLSDGHWGGTVEAVVNARHQFEPVMRAGGSWRNLAPVSDTRRAKIDTIINLVLEGRLPDLTHGARYFQNPQIVADRASRGSVPKALVNFGGAAPSAVIGAHSFYVAPGRGGRSTERSKRPPTSSVAPPVSNPWRDAGGPIFVGENRALVSDADPSGVSEDATTLIIEAASGPAGRRP